MIRATYSLHSDGPVNMLDSTAQFALIRTVRMLCFSFVLLTSQLATGAKAPVQSRDPLHEKLDFLKTSLERYLSHPIAADQGSNAGSVRFETLSFETCKVSWKISTEVGDGAEVPARLRNMKMLNQVSVNLASIDPARTTIRLSEQMRQHKIPWALGLELHIRPGTRGFTQQLKAQAQVTATTTQDARSYTFFFDYRDRQIAEDVSKAFADASNICRSKPPRSR